MAICKNKCFMSKILNCLYRWIIGHPVENLHDIKLSHPCNKNWNETFHIFSWYHTLTIPSENSVLNESKQESMFILICFVWYDILTYEVPQEQGYVFSSSVTFSVEWKVKGKKYKNMNEENTWGKTSWENFKNISQFQLYYCKSFQCSEHLYNEKYDVIDIQTYRKVDKTPSLTESCDKKISIYHNMVLPTCSTI